MIWQLDLIILLFLVVTALIALRVRDLLSASMIFGIYSFMICLLWAEMGRWTWPLRRRRWARG